MHAFIDIENAFDSVEASAVMKTLRRHEVEEIYVKILEEIYKESMATIKLHKVSEKIAIQKEIKQGNIISPKLFTAVLEEAFKNLDWKVN